MNNPLITSGKTPVQPANPDTHALGADEIDLMQFFITIWKGKWWVLSATAVSAVVALMVVLHLPNQYTASTTLMPASTSSTSSLSRLAGQFGSLASLAGISLGGQGEGDKVTAAIELLKSWGFQEQFVRDHHLEVPVFAVEGWDRQTNQLIVDPSIYDTRHSKWVRRYDVTQGQTAAPGGWELYKEFSKRISISQDKKTNLITLNVEYYSPLLAKEWVGQLVADVNKHLQEQDRIEAEKSIRYLEDKMSQTGLTEMKSVFSRLIEEQTKNLMLARVSDEYVLKTLSPAKMPEEKSSPNRDMIVLVATLCGGLLSVMSWMLWSMIESRRARLAG
jgi:uncharacterized protein involved in exopolysaccharide biosynthesis